MADGQAPQYSRRVTLIGRLRYEREGSLTLADGRLVFDTHETVFDVPVSELHSVMSSPDGFHVWHGSTAYRFRCGPASSRDGHLDGSSGIGLALSLLSAPGAFAEQKQSKRAGADWVARLTPAVGQPPPGVKVRRPWSTLKLVGAIVGGTVALTAAVTGLMFLFA